MPADDITAWDGCALSEAIHRRALSCREVMQAYLARIDALNPRVNALVGLLPHDGLLAQADARDAMLARGQDMGWMHGFPMAIKELSAVAGLPLTMGSPLLTRQIAPHDSLMVARMKAAGGSSGGAAVSLALHLQPVADGSDMMGSLRNPAAWNNVFGLRPSLGRAPYNPHAGDGYVALLGTEGPMGRTVRDVARLLSVMAGRDDRQPLSIAQDGSAFALPLEPHARGMRIGWLADLGGHLPFEPGILPLCEAALKRFEALGAVVETLQLGYPCDEVWQTWLTWRRFLVAGTLGPLGADPNKHAQLKPEAQWEYDQGQRLSGPQLYAASVDRTRFYRHMVTLFEDFDLLVLPSAQAWPFPAEWTWPREIAGRTMDTYHRWMEVVIYATLAGLPAMSVPAGFNETGLPMGLQLIGPPLGDLAVLHAAAAYEQTIGDWLARRPAIA